MWTSLRKFGSQSHLAGNAQLRSLARKNDRHLFDDIGLSQADFVNATEEQMRNRYWWML